MSTDIPKRIIQTARSANLPLLEKSVSVNLRLLNPDFQYLFFDDSQVEAFIDAEFPEHRAVFDAFQVRIQKYDFFRYLAVFRLGGFYFDTDVLLCKPLDDLLHLGCVFPFEELTVHHFLRSQYQMDWEIGNYAFGAAPGHPFLRAIIDNCVRAQREPQWAAEMMKPIPRLFRDDFYVYDTTGPGLVSRTLAEFPGAGEHVSVLFPADVRDPADWHRFGTHGVHLHGGSWRVPKSFVRRRMQRMWEARTRRALQKSSDARGPKRQVVFQTTQPGGNEA